MSSAKAALESDTRVLAYEAGRKFQVRVNTISAGPLGSRAAKAIGFIEDMIRLHPVLQFLAKFYCLSLYRKRNQNLCAIGRHNECVCEKQQSSVATLEAATCLQQSQLCTYMRYFHAL